MTLSAAIRAGVSPDPLRAAQEAVGIQDYVSERFGPIVNYVALRDRWPVLQQPATTCPVCGSGVYGPGVLEMVFHLYGQHQLSRDQIADYVEQWEGQP